MARRKQRLAAASRLEALPEGVLQLIGAALAAPQPPGLSSSAWHDPGTTTVAAAACMLACKGTQAIGLEAYRQLLARHQLPDMSQPPVGLSAASSTYELLAALEGWGVEPAQDIDSAGLPTLSCRSAKLWRQLQQALQPLCPVPERSRGPGSPLLQHAPWWEYLPLRPGQSMPWGQTRPSLPQLQRRSLQRYGGVKGWQRAWLREQRARRPQAREQDARRAELVAALQARGCELRDDSRLCAAYIEADLCDESRLCAAYIEAGKGNLHAIAVTMEKMKFFYSHTDYSLWQEKIIDDYYFLLGKRRLHNPERVSEEAKVQALHDWAEDYPGGPAAAADSSQLPDSLRKRVRAMVPKPPAKPKQRKPKPTAASQCPAPPAPQQAAATPPRKQQLEAAARQLAMQPVTEEQMQSALNGSRVLVCRVCGGDRKFGANGLADHCRAKHPNSLAGIWPLPV